MRAQRCASKTFNMDQLIRTGIIGFGMAGKVFHAPFISTLPGFVLSKISTSREAAAREIAVLYPDTLVVADARSVLDDNDIDLVIICTPNTEHLPLAKAAFCDYFRRSRCPGGVGPATTAHPYGAPQPALGSRL